MAIYHFSGQVISRSQGRSSVAAAAYRSAGKYLDERTGLIHDFTKKNDVIESEILLPKGAPDWMRDRQKLWNGVEQTEQRKDSQVAREFNIALPKELTPEQNWELLTEFVKAEFVDKGMIADVNFHRGHVGNDEQPHGHVMLTMREVNSDGFGQKVRAWNDKAILNDWREHWEGHCNRGLARQGFDLRIDHRTLEAQGINLEPQSKIGAKAAQLKMSRLAEHQALAERNGERILKDPEIALTALTHQQSTFTHQDIARFVNRHTIDEKQFSVVYEKVKAHPELVYLGKDDQHRDRFTTQKMLSLETNMLDQSAQKSQISGHKVADQYVEAAMNGKNLSLEQQAAFRHLIQGSDAVCVVGFAGTGKTYMLKAAREAWEAEGYRVQGVTLSGIAAENLGQGSGIVSRTVASRLWYWEQNRERLTQNDIIVVDEAGMLGSRQMARLVEEAHQSGAKIALIGDPEQLQAIEAGAAYRAIAQELGYVEMTDIRRQCESWQQQATRDFASAKTQAGLLAYEHHDNVHTFNTKETAIARMIEQWDEARSQAPDKSQIMLAYTRDEVKRLNEEARAMRRGHQELGKDYSFETARGPRNFAEQDRIYFLRNENRELYVKNGSLGTIEKIEGDKFTVQLDRGDQGRNGKSGKNGQTHQVEFSLKDYNDIDHGYAATIHKAQGVTVDRTHVLASNYFDRHTTYVAMSRHREGADLYYSRDDFPSFDQLNQTLSRERTKDVTLDYAQERGFDLKETHQVSQDVKDQPIEKQEKQEKQKNYAEPLTEDRLIQAEKRLAQRQYEKAMRQEIAVLEKNKGLSFSLELKDGDRGIYRGTVELVGRSYGILEQENKQAKLVPAEQLKSRYPGKEMVIERQKDYKGHQQLKGIQPYARERAMEHDFGMSF